MQCKWNTSSDCCTFLAAKGGKAWHCVPIQHVQLLHWSKSAA